MREPVDILRVGIGNSGVEDANFVAVTGAELAEANGKRFALWLAESGGSIEFVKGQARNPAPGEDVEVGGEGA